MSKMKSSVRGLSMLMMAQSIWGEFPYHAPKLEPNQMIVLKKNHPKGTKEYFFNEAGEFSTEEMLKAECVFKCYAINDKNAIRKFKNRK